MGVIERLLPPDSMAAMGSFRQFISAETALTVRVAETIDQVEKPVCN